MPLIWRKDAVKDCDGDREFVHRMGIGSTNSASIKNLTEISYFSLPNPKNWFLVKNTPNKLLRDLIDWDPSKRGFSPLICKSPGYRANTLVPEGVRAWRFGILGLHRMHDALAPTARLRVQ